LIFPQNVHKKQEKKGTTLWILIIFRPNKKENAGLLKYFFLFVFGVFCYLKKIPPICNTFCVQKKGKIF